MNIKALAGSSTLALVLAGGLAQAAIIEIPASALNNSPNVYTAGGY
ncbi:MAG: hypothetical protein LJE59_13250 [Chromatiaceae bacterium]|nr:hypothetical protein [Chromatiaceae bacterium]